MSHNFEDDDHKNFITVTGNRHPDLIDGCGDDEGTRISRAAWQLHAYATMTGLCEGNFGFVPDDYLSSIRAETVLTTLELVTAGLWDRVGTGYVIRDPYMLQLVLQADEQVRQTCKLENERNPQRL